MSKAKRITNDTSFDVAVIGVGPAGLMAALTAVESGKRVVILEKNDSPGKKLLMTGNGRCNFTHYEPDLQKLVESYGEKGSFLYSALSKFGVHETIDFFEQHGVKSHIEQDGRVFPKSNRAGDILNVFTDRLKGKNATLLYNSEVKELKTEGKRLTGAILTDGREIFADRFIISTGGKSYPVTGSTGDGYRWAKSLGHKIVPPAPALTPIKLRDEWIKNLQGLSLSGVGMSIFIGEQEIANDRGDVVFTHFGISGPLILNMSRYLTKVPKSGKVRVILDLEPDKDIEQIVNYFRELFKKNAVKTIVALLKELFPNRFACEILNMAGITSTKKVNQISKDERGKLIRLLKKIEMTLSGLCDFNYAMITSGGIHLAEVDPKTMGSKLTENLYFAGEVLDLDGPTGGYNLQICWSTGFLAGNI